MLHERAERDQGKPTVNRTAAEMLAGLAMMLDAVHVDDDLKDAIERQFDGLREECEAAYWERAAGLPEGPRPDVCTGYIINYRSPAEEDDQWVP